MEKKTRKTKTLKTKVENKEELVESPAEKKLPSLDPKARYKFISNGEFKTMPKGTEWNVTGETAIIFLKQGYGKLKD